jgi:hypothetical protein
MWEMINEEVEDTKAVVKSGNRRRSNKHNGQKEKGQKDKQRSALNTINQIIFYQNFDNDIKKT